MADAFEKGCYDEEPAILDSEVKTVLKALERNTSRRVDQ